MNPLAAGWRLHIHETLPSTSDLCRTLAEAGEPDGLAVLARRQTAGRGRAGRAWDGGHGNLAFSVLLRPNEPIRNAGQWSLLAGLVLIESLLPPGIRQPVTDPGHGRACRDHPRLSEPARRKQGVDPRPPPRMTGAETSLAARATVLRLKWPNDILLDGRKLAGVLLDSAATGDRLDWLVIGFGANLAAAPDIPDRPTAALAEAGPPPAPDDVAERILMRLDHWRGVRLRDGFAPVRQAWLAHAVPPGSPTTLRLPDRTVAGSFAGLAEDGGLLLQTEGRVHTFAVGEIVLGGVA